MPDASFPDLPALAQHLRDELKVKKSVLIYAYNSTGKTRLSTVFKDLGKQTGTSPVTTKSKGATETASREVLTPESLPGDTLYFNAYTEDLFFWDNDLK